MHVLAANPGGGWSEKWRRSRITYMDDRGMGRRAGGQTFGKFGNFLQALMATRRCTPGTWKMCTLIAVNTSTLGTWVESAVFVRCQKQGFFAFFESFSRFFFWNCLNLEDLSGGSRWRCAAGMQTLGTSEYILRLVTGDKCSPDPTPWEGYIAEQV